LIFTFFSVAGLPATDDVISDGINEILRSCGFRNVAVLTAGDNIFITYENYDYRFEPDAINAVLKKVFSVISGNPHFKVLILIPQRQQVPVIAIVVPLNKYAEGEGKEIKSGNLKEEIRITAEIEDYWGRLKLLPKNNSSISNLDISIEPRLRFQLGDYDYPFKYQFSLLPELSTSLWKGMRLSYQLFIPVINSHYVDKFNYLGPGLVTLNQFFRLPEGILANLTVGYFSRNRYGIDLEAGKYFFNDKIFFSFNAGFTGYAAFLKKGSAGISLDTVQHATFEYGALDYLTYRGSISCMPGIYDLSLDITFGRYLYNQKAIEIFLNRQFNEYDFSLIVSLTREGANFGFGMRIPVYPPKYLSNKKIRIRPSEYFNYSYLATGNFTYYYETGNKFYSWIKNFNPYFVKNQLKSELKY
jgi:hypothetical protein